MVEKVEDIERSAEEIVKSFIKSVENLPEQKEAYYSQEAYNIVRSDGAPTSETKQLEFRERFISNMPSSDEKGSLKVEVAKWFRER